MRTTLPPLDPAAVVHVDDNLISNLGAAVLLHAKMDHVESVENSAGREAVEEFWEKAVESKCEGLMIKVRGALSLIRFKKKKEKGFIKMMQLLDNTEVSSDIDTGTDATPPLADPGEEDADEFASPAKARHQGNVNGPHSKSRKKPLPATYEPGT